MKLDTTKQGWESVFKDYQILAVKAVYEAEYGATSKAVWDYANKNMEGTVSRASIINFLQWAEEARLIGAVKRSGKGGYHGVYKPLLSEEALSKLIRDRFTQFIYENLSGEIN